MPHRGAGGPDLARKEEARQTNLQANINPLFSSLPQAPPPNDMLQFVIFDAPLKFYHGKKERNDAVCRWRELRADVNKAEQGDKQCPTALGWQLQ